MNHYYDIQILTEGELAGVLKCSLHTIKRLREGGKIPFLKLGENLYRYNLHDVLKSLTTRFKRPKAFCITSEPRFHLGISGSFKKPSGSL